MRALMLVFLLLISSAASAKQLLMDTSMVGGIDYLLGTVREGDANACRYQYAVNGAYSPKWTFVEVCADNCFCDNPDNPTLIGDPYYGGIIEYTAGSKRATIDTATGELDVYVDTSEEWNNGCELNAGEHPYKEWNTPWNWHHLLINQGVDVYPTEHESVKLEFEAKLNASKRTSWQECEAEPEHNLWYVALRVVPRDGATSENPGGFALWRLWASGNTEAADVFKRTFNGLDPGGAWVYISRSAPSLGNEFLRRDQFKKYSVDVKRLLNEAAAVNKFDPNDYKVSVIYYGFEIWGGFELGVTTRDMKLIVDEPDEDIYGWYRYWNPTIGDHFYTKFYGPNGFSGWKFEGDFAGTFKDQLEGTVPLYEYWNREAGDHHFTTHLDPFGLAKGKWEYGGISAYVFENYEPGTVPVYEHWHPVLRDHLFSHSPNEGASVGYKCVNDCNPRWYMLK